MISQLNGIARPASLAALLVPRTDSGGPLDALRRSFLGERRPLLPLLGNLLFPLGFDLGGAAPKPLQGAKSWPKPTLRPLTPVSAPLFLLCEGLCPEPSGGAFLPLIPFL